MLEVDTNRSALVLIRHGRSNYTGTFPDLTPEGIEDIKKTAIEHKDLASKFVVVLPYSSQAPRALGSAHYYLEAIESRNKQVSIDIDLNPLNVKDLKGFQNYDKQNSTGKYGEMWLKDTFFSDSDRNTLTELRGLVEARSYSYLYRLINLLYRSRPVWIPTFTHFEIIAPIMKALYGSNLSTYPIDTEKAPQNGEALIVQVDEGNRRGLTITGRDISVRTEFNLKTGLFEHIA